MCGVACVTHPKIKKNVKIILVDVKDLDNSIGKVLNSKDLSLISSTHVKIKKKEKEN